LALTSPTSSGTVRLRTQATEFLFFSLCCLKADYSGVNQITSYRTLEFILCDIINIVIIIIISSKTTLFEQ
jgi:hypothetical protein